MGQRSGRIVDAIVVVGVLTLGLAEVFVPLNSRQGEGSTIVSGLQVVIVAMALWWRRSHPVPTLAVVLLALVVPNAVAPGFLLFFGQLVPIWIAVYSVARYGQGREPWIGAAMFVVVFVFADLTIELLGGVEEMLYHWGTVLLAFGLGLGQAAMARRAEESRQRAIRVEVEAAEHAMQAVLAERTRIARELHDIVAHSMSVMVVQAGAAEAVVDVDPVRARGALENIRRTGTEALADMRRVVTMLRDTDEVGPLAPQPGLDGLKALVDDARAAGLPVELDVSGDPRDLPAGTDLAAYRIVQESLTNARRHALHATRVRVQIEYDDTELRITVTDDGRGSETTVGSGHGLVGMRERVELYGGSLQAGPAPDGGFSVVAAIPLEPVALSVAVDPA